MPRAATNSDVFNAVAEPQRRAILHFLAGEARPVGDIVAALELAQPSVSKHLRRRMFYRTNPEGIRPLHEWTSQFERYWRNQLTRIKERAERG